MYDPKDYLPLPLLPSNKKRKVSSRKCADENSPAPKRCKFPKSKGKDMNKMRELFKCEMNEEDVKLGKVPKLKIKRKISDKEEDKVVSKRKKMPKIKSIVQLTVGTEGDGRGEVSSVQNALPPVLSVVNASLDTKKRNPIFQKVLDDTCADLEPGDVSSKFYIIIIIIITVRLIYRFTKSIFACFFLQILESCDAVAPAEPSEVDRLFENYANDPVNNSFDQKAIWPPTLPLAVMHHLPGEVDAWAQNLLDNSGNLQNEIWPALPSYSPPSASTLP